MKLKHVDIISIDFAYPEKYVILDLEAMKNIKDQLLIILSKKNKKKLKKDLTNRLY
jgi:hypothetical protein